MEASKMENKIPFQLQRLNWYTKEMTSYKTKPPNSGCVKTF